MTPRESLGGSDIAKLVEKQMRNWELARAQRLSVPEPDRQEVEDFVTISREVGAGGHEVAAILGERLNWPVFDKEILDAMAGDDALRRQIYHSMDERDIGWFEEAARAFTQTGFVKNDYFHSLTRTVLSLARQGRAVFLGRGADMILPRQAGVRVRLVAPVDLRVRHFAKLYRMSTEKAREEVSRIDNERAEFFQNQFHISSDEPTRWDLTINRERFSAEQTVELILAVREKLTTGD